MTDTKEIIGRYAPSPTGNLHLGNLRSALLAWLHVRLQGGIFKLRMDDLDLPRVVTGSADQILRDLEWLGLDWDGEVVYQSQRTDLYQQALEKLNQQGLIYECFCSRKDIQQAASAPHVKQGVYPGTCAELDRQAKESKRQQKVPALRICVNDETITFFDGCLGRTHDELKETCGDFVVKRADGLFAYQLATAVDDIQQEITDVVRGADLVDSTARQIYLIQRLSPEFAIPEYWHVPLMMDEQGERMAKRDGSLSIAEWQSDGGDAESLVGLLAASAGLIGLGSAISMQELLDELTLDKWQQAVQIKPSGS